MDNVARWRRLRGDWLRAAVWVSFVQQQHEHPETKRRRVADETDVSPVAPVSPVHTFLHDARMHGHDDGDGKPLRYLSWFGGIVTRFL